MDGRSMGVDDALPGYAGSYTADLHIHAHDLIGVAVESVAAGVTLVRVRGEVDLFTAPVLRGELDHQLNLQPSALIIDLSRVTYFGAIGIEVLIDAYLRACKTETLLRLVDNTRAVARTVKILQLDHLFPIYHGLADTLAG